MAEAYRVKVGAVRPSHLMFTSGVGSLVDLPNFSAIVLGLEEWDYRAVPGGNVLTEPRLLAAVRQIRQHRDVKELRGAPWQDEADVGDEAAARIGVPTRPFPTFLRCTACNELGSLESGGPFRFENAIASRPHDAQFVHQTCPRVRRGRKPLAVTARFVLACTNGHLDDFPYVPFVHRGATCPNVPYPPLAMDDHGGNLGANVTLRCQACGARRNIGDAQRTPEVSLPACRGRHPHLGIFEPGGCSVTKDKIKLLVVGASNQWFARGLSVLSVPQTGATALATLVEKHWDVLSGVSDRTLLSFLWSSQHQVTYAFEGWDVDDVWAAIEAHRAGLGDAPDDDSAAVDLRTPEWQIFTTAKTPEPTPDFTLRRDPDGVPKELAGVYADVVQAERLREVRALVGFTRLDSPDPEDPDLIVTAPLSRGEATWVPSSEVRGEGLFFRIPEDLLVDWERRAANSEAMRLHFAAYQQFRRNRYSDRVQGAFDPAKNWPGPRYWVLHTLSHLLIRTIAAECGYSSASLSERIYSSVEGENRSGILIYTAVPDAEGTLGGLVSLGERRELVRITLRALRDARRCSSDPLCAERLPHSPEDFLHGAACHVCLFVSETTCERGNRFLDRRFVVPLGDDAELALFRDLP